MAYLDFHALLYFENQIFLVLDNAFSYYNKDTEETKNKVINGRNIVFCFSYLSML